MAEVDTTPTVESDEELAKQRMSQWVKPEKVEGSAEKVEVPSEVLEEPVCCKYPTP